MFLKLGEREYRVDIHYDPPVYSRRGVIVTILDPEGVAVSGEARMGKKETMPYNPRLGRWLAFRRALRAYCTRLSQDPDTYRPLWRGLSRAFAERVKVV